MKNTNPGMQDPLPNGIAFACLALSMSLVGSYVALSKPLVAAFGVFLLAWLRFGIGAVAMLRWLRRPVDEPPLTPRVRGLVFLESFLGNFLFTLCMLYGVSMTSAISAGVIMASIPAMVAVLSWIFLREHIGARVWAGVLCSALGIGMLALGRSDAHGAGVAQDPGLRQALIGNVLVFLSVLCEASYAVIGKKLTGVLTPKRISALINLWGFALMTPLGVVAAWSFDFGSIAPATWTLLLFYALAASVWTVWLWMTGLRSVPAARAGVFTVMLPLATAAVGVIWLGESMDSLQGLAFLLALAAIVLATLPQGAVKQAR